MKNGLLYFAKSPKKLFLLDAIGAAMTSSLLFFVLKIFTNYFGVPEHIAEYLSLSGLVLFLYSLNCFLFLKSNWQPFLRVIAIGNILYCLTTSILICLNFQAFTPLGKAYFIIEIGIVLSVAFVELRVANLVSIDNKSNEKI